MLKKKKDCEQKIYLVAQNEMWDVQMIWITTVHYEIV